MPLAEAKGVKKFVAGPGLAISHRRHLGTAKSFQNPTLAELKTSNRFSVIILAGTSKYLLALDNRNES